MLSNKPPVVAKPRSHRFKGRQVVVHRNGDTYYTPPLRFKSMAACLRHFGMWQVNTTRAFSEWVIGSGGRVIAELTESHGGPFMMPGAGVAPVVAPVAPPPVAAPPPVVPAAAPLVHGH